MRRSSRCSSRRNRSQHPLPHGRSSWSRRGHQAGSRCSRRHSSRPSRTRRSTRGTAPCSSRPPGKHHSSRCSSQPCRRHQPRRGTACRPPRCSTRSCSCSAGRIGSCSARCSSEAASGTPRRCGSPACTAPSHCFCLDPAAPGRPGRGSTVSLSCTSTAPAARPACRCPLARRERRQRCLQRAPEEQCGKATSRPTSGRTSGGGECCTTRVDVKENAAMLASSSSRKPAAGLPLRASIERWSRMFPCQPRYTGVTRACHDGARRGTRSARGSRPGMARAPMTADAAPVAAATLPRFTNLRAVCARCGARWGIRVHRELPRGTREARRRGAASTQTKCQTPTAASWTRSSTRSG